MEFLRGKFNARHAYIALSNFFFFLMAAAAAIGVEKLRNFSPRQHVQYTAPKIKK